MKAPGLSLSQRLLLLTMVAWLPALAILGFNEFSLRKAREAEVHAQALRMSEQASLEVERILTGAAALMIAVANAPGVGENGANCRAYMDRLSALLPQISLLNITDMDGQSVCATSGQPEDLRPALSAPLRDALADQLFAVGEYTVVTAGPALLMGTQRTAADGSLQGFVIATIGLDYLGRVLKERPFAQGSAMTIADRNGTIIAREPQPERFVGMKVPEEYMSRVTGTAPGTLQIMSQDGTERIIGYQPASQRPGLYVSTGIPVSEAMAPINEATLRGLLLAGVGGILAMVLALVIGRRFIRRPVLRLLATIHAWRAGDQSARSGMLAGRAEFHQVGAAIDDLLDELARRQAAQLEAEQHRDLLARELDHRIKNLLAVTHALARQTAVKGRTAEEYRAAFLGRFEALGRSLAVSTSSDSAKLPDLAQAVMEPYLDGASTVSVAEGPAVGLLPPQAISLGMILHEMATNATKYGALSVPGGQVAITWEITPDEGGASWIHLSWQESNGPETSRPISSGFGSRMIRFAAEFELGGSAELNYLPEGLKASVSFPRLRP